MFLLLRSCAEGKEEEDPDDHQGKDEAIRHGQSFRIFQKDHPMSRNTFHYTQRQQEK